ncbi:MAG: SOS response-associated peptidase [Chromatiales bacterium]|jgi:putative SOS response-associated peptidase YedK
MCGRYVQSTPINELANVLEARVRVDEWRPRYNITPGSMVLACRLGDDGGRDLVLLHWGLIPSWAKDRKLGFRTINARAETVADKPAFRAAFKRRRCLIPADGYYEWRATASGKQPYFFSSRDGRPLAFAGLWEQWTDKETGEQLQSCTIIVTEASERLRPIHDRMPVVLGVEDYAIWLDCESCDRERLRPLLRPAEPDAIEVHAVDRRVNSPAHDDPSLIEPIPDD